jgi:hypothetical protein
MTVFLTIFSGVVTFVLGQLTLKLLIEPVQEFKKTIADIALSLIEYSNIYANPGVAGVEVEKKASEELRKLSSRLNAQVYLIPFYGITAQVFRLPSRKQVVNAVSALIGLSNGVFKSSTDLVSTNLRRAESIRSTLGIYVPDNERLSVLKPQPNTALEPINEE